MNYSAAMEFEWDETKSEACFAERGFDFACCSCFSRPEPCSELGYPLGVR